MIFSDVTFGINQGDKIALIAKNGTGKTTLLRCIAGSESVDSGKITPRKDLKIGFLEQTPDLPEGMTVGEFTGGDDRLKRLLTQMEVYESDALIETLSGGQHKRLAIARVIADQPDLLILDEPTNHLDMKTKDILKQAIKDFDGTVIVVSHDREFLDGLVEKVYEFGGGKVKECLGGIYEFLEKKKISSLRELELTQSPTAEKNAIKPTQTEKPHNIQSETAATDSQQKATPAAKLSYAEQREREKMLRKASKKIEEAEQRIADIEKEIADIETRIANGETDGDIFNRHSATTRNLENAMSLWELASMEFDNLKQRLM